MHNNIILVSTTPQIEGWSIKEYFGVVTYQLVIGANIFRDVFASFRDIFGGSAKGYQKELERMEEIALDNLKRKASKMGANMIIDLRLDFEEVSGGSKSMFMLSASGTAVFSINIKSSNNDPIEKITSKNLNFEINRDLIQSKVNSTDFNIKRSSDINPLIEYEINAIVKVIAYLENFTGDESEIRDIISAYFQRIPSQYINEYLSSNNINTVSNITFAYLIEILKTIKWFDDDVIRNLLRNSNPKSLYLLTLDREFYTKNDIGLFKDYIQLLALLKKEYPVVYSSTSVLGKEKLEWKCLNCGVMNHIKVETCRKHECNANIFGIPNDIINPDILIKAFNKKIEKIQQIL